MDLGLWGRESGLEEIALATLLQRILGAVQPASAPRALFTRHGFSCLFSGSY